MCWRIPFKSYRYAFKFPSHCYMFRLAELAENLGPYLYYLTDLILELYLLLQRQCIVDWVYWHSPKLLSSASLVHVGIPHSSCGLYLSKHISWWTQISCTSSWMWRQNHNRPVYCKYLLLVDGSKRSSRKSGFLTYCLTSTDLEVALLTQK